MAEGRELDDTLGQIAKTAAELVRAKAAAIILRAGEAENGLSVAGSYGLSEKYSSYLNRDRPIEVGKGPSGLAVRRGSPVAIADVLESIRSSCRGGTSPCTSTTGRWSRCLSAHESGSAIGVLNAYREQPGKWTTQRDRSRVAARRSRGDRDPDREAPRRLPSPGDGVLADGSLPARADATSTRTDCTRSTACSRWARSTTRGA